MEDWKGAETTRSECLWVTPRPATAIPHARVGSVRFVPEGDHGKLDGSQSYGGFQYGHRLLDQTLPIVSYQWTLVNGPSVTLVDANAARTTFTAPQVDRDTPLVFHLAVEDSLGNRGGANITYTVVDHNVAPYSSAGLIRTPEGDVNGCPTFRLVSYSSDPDGDGIASYRWRVTSGIMGRTTTGRLAWDDSKVLATFTTNGPVVEGWIPPRVEQYHTGHGRPRLRSAGSRRGWSSTPRWLST